MYFCDECFATDQYEEELDKIIQGDDDLKTSSGFTLFENGKEFASWIQKQNVKRSINKLQVHHMALPDYSTWEKTDKRIFGNDPELGRTNSLDSYGKSTWGSKSANGKYIAQHFNIFPNGKITTGRSLESNPIGISGWNTGAICIEIYGNFDKGKDTMTQAQKDSVIAVYGELCKKFNLTPSASTIRYHAWFKSNGTYLGDYKAGQSRKTCPGTAFFGGNTMSAFKKNFLPAIQDYINGEKKEAEIPSIKVDDPVVQVVNKIVKINVGELNVRKNANASSQIMGVVKDGEVYTIVKESNGWGLLKSGLGWINLKYTEPVSNNDSFKVRINTGVLNIRQSPNTSSKVVGSVKDGEVYTIIEKQGIWGKLKSGAGWICLTYVERVD